MFDNWSLLLVVRFHCLQVYLHAGMKERKRGKVALLKTTEEFAERTTIHGIAYAFDKGLWIADRLLWTVIVIGFLVLAFFLTWDSWTQWKDEQVCRPWGSFTLFPSKKNE